MKEVVMTTGASEFSGSFASFEAGAETGMSSTAMCIPKEYADSLFLRGGVLLGFELDSMMLLSFFPDLRFIRQA